MSEIFKAMAAVMTETTAIGKDQKNAQQGFKYRGIDDIYNSMHFIFAKHGIFMTPEILDKTREERTNKNGTVLAFTTLRIKYTFWANDGSSVSCTVEGEGMDSGDKSSNKAMAVAHKYAILQTFCIPTAEQKDPDAEVHEVAPRKPVTEAPKAPPYIKPDELKKELEGAFSLEEMREIYKQRMPVINHHYNAKEKAEIKAFSTELSKKFAA